MALFIIYPHSPMICLFHYWGHDLSDTFYFTGATPDHAPNRQYEQPSPGILGGEASPRKNRWDRQKYWYWFCRRPTLSNFSDWWLGSSFVQESVLAEISWLPGEQLSFAQGRILHCRFGRVTVTQIEAGVRVQIQYLV